MSADEGRTHAELLNGLVDTFEKDPTLCRKSMHDLLRMDSQKFTRGAFQVLIEGLAAGQQYLLYMLMLGVSEDAVLNLLIDSTGIETTRARELAQSLGEIDPNLGSKLLKYLTERIRAGDGSDECIERTLDLAGTMPEGRASTAYLLELLRSNDTRIRSKATLLLARSNQTPRWTEVRMSEADPRVRANAIEGLWNVRQPGAEQVLRSATRDPNHRVVVNAWIGLHYMGVPEAAAGLLQLASNDAPLFRAAAAWGMGHLAELEFQTSLQKMVRDDDAAVRRNALRALAKIRKKQAQADPAVTVPV